jgi:hypothetical protein
MTYSSGAQGVQYHYFQLLPGTVSISCMDNERKYGLVPRIDTDTLKSLSLPFIYLVIFPNNAQAGARFVTWDMLSR